MDRTSGLSLSDRGIWLGKADEGKKHGMIEQRWD